MPPAPLGQPKEMGSADGSISEHNLQLAEHQVPVLIPGAPTLRDALRGQIEHPAQRVVVGEAGLVFRDLPELTVQALDNVRRVYDFPNFQTLVTFPDFYFPLVYALRPLRGLRGLQA